MDWRSAIAANWPYKLAAAALAVLLWFNVTADEQRQEQMVPTRLEVVLQDSGWVPVEAPDEVMTTFQGRRGDFFAFALRGNRPVIRKEIRQVRDSVMRVALSPGEVTYDPQLDIRAVAVRPSEVRLAFEPVTGAQVPVTIDLQASAAEGFTVVGSPLVRPESVTVRGARSQVASLSHVETEPIEFDQVETTVTRQVPVRVPQDLATVAVEPEQVLVTLEVDTLVERSFRLPVRLTDAQGWSARPDSVDVTVRGARSILAALRPEEVRAVATWDGNGTRQRRVPLEVRLGEGVTATATVEPPTVTLVPEEGEGGSGDGR